MSETQNLGAFEIIIALIVLLFYFASTVWTSKLKGEYLNSYTLKNASSKEKYRWAIQLITIQFGALGILLVFTVIGLSSAKDSLLINLMKGVFCISGLIVASAALVTWENQKIETKLTNYIKWDKEKKKDRLTKKWLFSNTGNLSSEVKERFWKFGYSDECLEEEGLEAENLPVIDSQT